MNGNESGHAREEARRDVINRAVTPSSEARYDALLRYLRGLYVRPQKTASAPQRTEAAGAARSVEQQPQDATAKDATAKDARRRFRKAKPGKAPKPAKAAKR
ncbi:hypothetical protein KGA66_22780 [Actinocrinis puniceicyclus]|uniref:Uncharacterized protein n=1 Tax=Actinocrinis puniceicyclus TaxID=977794 RepID=A0A8J7WSX5_9ACTN|nr:hypothetical protein [Actinocrinis puniceicyclus]MBS2965892.1 hypothetical protein [Actinocrinis puniceicyclus]